MSYFCLRGVDVIDLSPGTMTQRPFCSPVTFCHIFAFFVGNADDYEMHHLQLAVVQAQASSPFPIVIFPQEDIEHIQIRRKL